MKRFNKIFFLLLLLIPMFGFVSILNAASGTTYYSIATGNWTSPSSWSLTSGGPPLSAGYPGANDVVVIELGKTITINGGENISASSITIGGASTSGILYFNPAGSATLNISGDLTIGGGNLGASGALNYGGWGLEITCARLLKGTGGASRGNALSQDFTFTGSFTLNAGFNEFRNFRVNGGVVTLSSNIETNGSNSPWIFSGSTLDLGTYTMTIGGYLEFRIDGTLIVGGANNFPSTYETLVIGPNSTVKYNYNGNQNIWPLDYANLVIAGGGEKCTTGIISSLSLIDGGTGYENDWDAILNFSGGDGIGAAGTINIDDNEGDYTNIDGEWVLTDPNPNYGKISSVALTNFGSGYTSAPSVSIGGRSEWSYIMGSGAVITANFRNTYTASNITKQDGALFCGETPSSLLSIFSPLATLTSCLGSSSSHTTFDVTGSDLTASVTITVPSDFEISTSSDGFYSTSTTLTNTSTVSQTLYIRLNSSATVGEKSGTITATSTDATDVITTISGTVNSLPNIGISGTTTNPELVSLTATASEGSTYAWSDGSSTSSAINTFDASGLYSLTVTDANGCISSTQFNITVQHWGLSRTGEKILDSASQINANGQIGSLNPISQEGKKREYKSSSSFVRDGLVLNLDAGNTFSYPGTGTTWTDLSGSNNGSMTDVTYTASPGYFNFNGSSSKIAFSSGITSGDYLTYEVWVNPTTLNGFSVIANSNNWNTGYVHFQFYGTYPSFDLNGGGDQTSSASFSVNTWYNLVTVYSKSNMTVSFYVNGALIETKNIIESPPSIANTPFTIGAWENDRYFNGKISIFRAYNIAFDSTKVLSNYNALKSRFGL